MSDSNKALKEKLLSSRKNGFDRVDAAELEQMESYCRDYMAFLNAGKTERLCAAETVRLAERAGYKPLTRGQALRAGDKVYVCNRGKSVLLAHIGSKPIAEGAQITAAHIDSPRLDLKPNPLYEDSELAYFKTHYYGGIRKYQWVTIPMELHGVVAMTDGTTVTVNIGAEEGDPKLVITDLLPHLGQEQSKKPLAEGILGEQLNLLLGSRPIGDEEGSDRVKLAVMQLLNEKYGITEDDFTSAELEAVPAVKATEIGLDRSMIGSYGHDDRVCGYAALKALLDLNGTPAKTAVCVLDHTVNYLFNNLFLSAVLCSRYKLAVIIHIEERTYVEHCAENLRGLCYSAAAIIACKVGRKEPMMNIELTLLGKITNLFYALAAVFKLCQSVH